MYARGNSLQLGVKVESRLSIKVISTLSRDRSLVSSERKHGQWNGDRGVDSNLAGLNVTLEPGCGSSAIGEDSNPVTIFVGVDKVNGVLECVDIHAHKDRAEDFLGITLHMRLDVGNDCWGNLGLVSGVWGWLGLITHEISVGVFLRLVPSAIQEQCGAVINSALDKALDSLLRVLRNDRSKISALLKPCIDFKLLRLFDHIRKPLLGSSNKR